jgi:L-threonylcarbamoyladenylate synthase
VIVHVDQVAMARACVSEWPATADRLASRFWPGPLTLVLPRAPKIPALVSAGLDTVGVRIPRHEVARELIARTGLPIAAPSANRSTRISPTEAWHVMRDLDGLIDLVLDSGPTAVGIESTVVDLSVHPSRVLRPGSVTIEALSEALGEPVLGPSGPSPGGPHASPGQMELHYAPQTPTYRIDRERFDALPARGRWALIALGSPAVWPLGSPPERCVELGDPIGAEAELYARLHDCDAAGFDFLVVQPPPDEPRWLAIRDRLRRASSPWPDAS